MPILFIDKRTATHYRWGPMSKEETKEEIERLRAQAQSKLDKASRLEAGLQHIGGPAEPPSMPAISPHTKLPVEHPESQAVERILYETGQSLCGEKATDAVPADLFPKKPKE
jgi:hypothetical protein